MLPGPFNSPESLAAFAKLQLELATTPVATPTTADGLTVNELLLAYLTHAEQHYRGEDGKPTDEVRHLKAAIRHVRELYGDRPVTEFGPLALRPCGSGSLTRSEAERPSTRVWSGPPQLQEGRCRGTDPAGGGRSARHPERPSEGLDRGAGSGAPVAPSVAVAGTGGHHEALTLGLLGLALGAASAENKKELPKDLSPLQGAWRLFGSTFDALENRAVGPDPKIAFDGAKLKSTTGKDGWAEDGVVTVDAQKSPAEFTLERDGKKTLGIYKLADGKLHGATGPEKGTRLKSFADRKLTVSVDERPAKNL
jgi:uncharacterized protein (TIGR03067 family)